RPGRAQRLSRRLRPDRTIRPSARARMLRAGDRSVPKARQALRRRRACHAAGPDRRIRADGRALRLLRHRRRIPSRRGGGEGQAGERDQALMAPPQAKAGLGYASAVAADAFARSLLHAHGIPDDDAATVAGCLVSADLRGVDTHGLCRLPIYLERVRAGLINAKPNLNLERVTPVAATLDGDNGFGFVVGTRAMQEAIAMAREFGIGVVSARRSTHFGMAASYAIPAVEAGLMAMVFSNASQAMPPWGSKQMLLGTNPFCMA